jgi:hypothetical protein
VGGPSHDAALLEIVRAAQGAAVYDKWVRVLVGVVEEVLLAEEEDDNDNKQDGEVNETNRTKTCRKILDRLRKLESNSTDDDYAPVEDADPLFVPYRYHLLPSPLLQTVLPETSVQLVTVYVALHAGKKSPTPNPHMSGNESLTSHRYRYAVVDTDTDTDRQLSILIRSRRYRRYRYYAVVDTDTIQLSIPILRSHRYRYAINQSFPHFCK